MKHTLKISGIVLLLGLFVFGCSDDDGGSGPVTAGDFSGNWDLVGKVVSKAAKTCESDVGDTFTDDAVITQEGNKATIQTPDGPLTLTVSGNRASGSMSYSEGDYSETTTVVLKLERGGSFLSGTVTDEIEEGEFSCTEVAELLGVKEGTEPSGDFNGYWSGEGTIVEDTCEIGPLEPGCFLLVQYDEVILLIDQETAFVGTVTGNTAVFPLDSESDYMNITGAITLTMGSNINKLTGSQILTMRNPSNPLESCGVNVAITADRVPSCSTATSFGGLQLLR